MPEVRVIGEDGEQLGVMDVRDAIRQAREKGLDLVEVAATADAAGAKPFAHPKYWAAFVLIGDPS